MSEILLQVRELTVRFARRGGWWRRDPGFAAVGGVSFDLGAGETVGVVGESGSGKSTLARAILRLVPVHHGSVVFDSVDVLRARGAALRRVRRGVQIVFQDPAGSLNPRIRVGEAVAEPLVVHGVCGRAEAARRAAALLEQCGLPGSSAGRFPHEFSGGQRQRIAIARALAISPRLIICDEPTSALDVSVQAQILNLLTDLQRERGLAYLFITHDLGVVRHVAHRVVVMKQGCIVETGPREQIFTHPGEDYTRELLGAAGG
ncbi:Glutathione import ATP-binding protein GsiA [Phycisphaerales bacterium]|nr:Glutathione import ATP-binding protein GsiA [Phycisphaerales bacterium]